MKGIVKISTNLSKAKGVNDGSQVVIHSIVGQSLIVSKSETSEQFKISKRFVEIIPDGCPVPAQFLTTKVVKENVKYSIGDVVKIVNNCPKPATGQTKELLGHVGVVASDMSANGSHKVQIYTPEGGFFTNASGEYPSFKACNLQLTNEPLTRSNKNFSNEVFVSHQPPPVSAKKAATMTQSTQCSMPYDEYEGIADDCIEAIIDFGLNAKNVDSVHRPTVQSRLRKRFSSRKASGPCPVPLSRRTSAERVVQPVVQPKPMPSMFQTQPVQPVVQPVRRVQLPVFEEDEEEFFVQPSNARQDSV